MEPKWKTLIECYEENGKKLPFKCKVSPFRLDITNDETTIYLIKFVEIYKLWDGSIGGIYADSSSTQPQSLACRHNNPGFASLKAYILVKPLTCSCDRFEYEVLRNKPCPHEE